MLHVLWGRSDHPPSSEQTNHVFYNLYPFCLTLQMGGAQAARLVNDLMESLADALDDEIEIEAQVG